MDTPKLKISFDIAFKSLLLLLAGTFLYLFYAYSQNGNYIKMDDRIILNTRTGKTYHITPLEKPTIFSKEIEE